QLWPADFLPEIAVDFERLAGPSGINWCQRNNVRRSDKDGYHNRSPRKPLQRKAPNRTQASNRFGATNWAAGVQNRVARSEVIAATFRNQKRDQRDHVQKSDCSKTPSSLGRKIEPQTNYRQRQCEESQLHLIGQEIFCSPNTHVSFMDVPE